jgi:hypothetical protein
VVRAPKKAAAVCTPAFNLRHARFRNECVMSKVNVKNGTPVGNAHLCDSCHWGQFITGYRESDRLAICTNTSPNVVLPFTVYACTNFSDKHRPDWEQMEKLAIDIRPVRVSKKTAGFSTKISPRPAAVPGDGDKQDEAAITR